MTITTPETPPGTPAPITRSHPATLAFRLFGITIASIEFDHPDLTSGWHPKAAPMSPVPTQVRRASRRFARWVITHHHHRRAGPALRQRPGSPARHGARPLHRPRPAPPGHRRRHRTLYSAWPWVSLCTLATRATVYVVPTSIGMVLYLEGFDGFVRVLPVGDSEPATIAADLTHRLG